MTAQHPTPFHLGSAVDADGFGPHEQAVAQLVRLGVEAGASQVLLGVLADRTQPEVARARALGRVLVHVAGGSTLRTTRVDLVAVA